MKYLFALTAAILSTSMAFAAVPATSDDFESETLGTQWQWKNAPASDDAASLTASRGKLRLKTTSLADNLQSAPGTLVQPVADQECTAVVKFNTARMQEGDVAGFGIVNGTSDFLLSVKGRGIRRFVVMQENDYDKATIPMLGYTVYLRVEIGADHKASLSFSPDNELWTPVAVGFSVAPSSQYVIYNYATKKKGGYIDVDFFHLEF